MHRLTASQEGEAEEEHFGVRTLQKIKPRGELFVGRATTLFVMVVLLVGVLALGLLELRFWNYDTYASRSDDNRMRVQTLAPPRGMIFDRNGRLLADNQNASSLALVVDEISDVQTTVDAVTSVLALSDAQEEEVLARLKQSGARSIRRGH